MNPNNNVEPILPDTYTAHDIYRLVEENKKLKTQVQSFKTVIEEYLEADDGGGKAYIALVEYKKNWEK